MITTKFISFTYYNYYNFVCYLFLLISIFIVLCSFNILLLCKGLTEEEDPSEADLLCDLHILVPSIRDIQHYYIVTENI